MFQSSRTIEKCIKQDKKLAGLRKELEKAQIREDAAEVEKLEREIQKRELQIQREGEQHEIS